MVHPIRLSLVVVLALLVLLALPRSSMAAPRHHAAVSTSSMGHVGVQSMAQLKQERAHDSRPQNPPAPDPNSAIVLLTRCTKDGNCNSYLSTTCSNGVQFSFKTGAAHTDTLALVINPAKNTISIFMNGNQEAANITPTDKGVINFPAGSPLTSQLGASSATVGVSGLLVGSNTYPFAGIRCA